MECLLLAIMPLFLLAQPSVTRDLVRDVECDFRVFLSGCR